MNIVTILGIKMERVTVGKKIKLRKIIENTVRLRPPTKKEEKKHIKLIKKQRRKNA